MKFEVLCEMLTDINPEIIISIFSIAVSVFLVLLELNKNANEQLKASLADKRPLIIGSIYSNMDYYGTAKRRGNFTRYIAKTYTYKFESLNKLKEERVYAYLRIRNESNSDAHNVIINVKVKNKKYDFIFKQKYTINIIASFCEYMFIIPTAYINDNGYFDEYEISVNYRSIAGEKIEYLCKYNSAEYGKVYNTYIGKYYKKIKRDLNTRENKPIKTFYMQNYADTMETIEL